MCSKKAALFALGLLLALPLAAGPGGQAPVVPVPGETQETPDLGPLPVDPLFEAEPLACVPYGNLCDPRYVPGAVCCPGTHCVFLYPGVPQFCL